MWQCEGGQRRKEPSHGPRRRRSCAPLVDLCLANDDDVIELQIGKSFGWRRGLGKLRLVRELWTQLEVGQGKARVVKIGERTSYGGRHSRQALLELVVRQGAGGRDAQSSFTHSHPSTPHIMTKHCADQNNNIDRKSQRQSPQSDRPSECLSFPISISLETIRSFQQDCTPPTST